MDEFVDIARTLIVLGLVLLLFMLRLDAERFGTAEYYEATQDGERPRARRRLAWYGIGVALAVAIVYVHPSPQQTLFLGSGNRLGAVLGGLAYGLAGVGVAVAFATVRYHRIRFPEPWSYPGALLNSVATAFIDEVAFRGALFGLLLCDRPRADGGEPHPGAAVRADDPARGARAATATCWSWPSGWASSAAG